MKKRLLTILMTVCLVMGGFFSESVHAYAEPTVIMGTMPFATLQDAIDFSFDDSEEPTTIALLKDIELEDDIFIKTSKNIVLDLNDHTICVGEYGIFNTGILKITDSVNDKVRYYTFDEDNYVYLQFNQASTASTDSNYREIRTKGGTIWGKRPYNLRSDKDEVYVNYLDVIQNVGTLILEKGNIVGNSNKPGIIRTDDVEIGQGAAVHNTVGATFIMNGGRIAGNFMCKSKYIGAVYNEGEFIMNGGKIECNHSKGSGAGLYNKAAATIKHGTISNNIAYSEGGGIYNDGSLVITEAKICDNQLDTFDNLLSFGGAIYNGETGVVVSEKGYFFNNAAGSGGAIYNCGMYFMYDGEIYQNKADYIAGGFYNAGIFEFNGGKIDSNCSGTAAGGILNSDSSTIIIDGGSVVGNKTNTMNAGGGILNLGKLKLSKGTICDNVAYNGGGILNTGLFEMSGGSISGNIASNMGGAIFNENEVTINGGVISKNKADVGGAIANYYETRFTMTNGSITENTASANSAIYSIGKIRLLGGSITDNLSISNYGSNYGAVWNMDADCVTLGGDIVIKGNLAYDGTERNLYLDNYDSYSKLVLYVQQDDDIPLKKGAEIHITVSDKDHPIMKNLNNKTYSNYFVSDNEDYGVIAAKNDDKYELILKEYCTVVYDTIQGQTPTDDNKYLPGQSIKLAVPVNSDSGDYRFAGWKLYSDFPSTSEGIYNYEFEDSDAGQIVCFYQTLIPKISDINGQNEEILTFTEGNGSNTTIHITGLEMSDLLDDDPSKILVQVDKNGNGTYETDEKLVYGEDFTVESGSIKVIIQKDYLNSLRPGNHAVHIEISDKDPDIFSFDSLIKTVSAYRVVNTSTK